MLNEAPPSGLHLLSNWQLDRVENARRTIKDILRRIEDIPAEERPDNCAHTLWCEDIQWLHARIIGMRKYGQLNVTVTLAAVSLLLAEKGLPDGCEARKSKEAEGA